MCHHSGLTRCQGGARPQSLRRAAGLRRWEKPAGNVRRPDGVLLVLGMSQEQKSINLLEYHIIYESYDRVL